VLHISSETAKHAAAKIGMQTRTDAQQDLCCFLCR